jgi:alpha-tubulin suppressor-like RCC1 family protein
MAAFRFITPTDVDSFIQLPGTLEVDARSLVITVEEDTLKNFERQFQIMDYTIYCEAPQSHFFDSSMDWKYKIVQEFDASGNYLGPTVVDAHEPLTGQPLTMPITNSNQAKVYLGATTQATRFAHYKQCNRFFKYSFKVGDEMSVGGRDSQLFGVYLDGTTGDALPYWETTNPDAGQMEEAIRILYASGIDLSAIVDVSGTPVVFTDENAVASTVTLVCPPHPEFLESTPDLGFGMNIGRNLATHRDGSGNPVVRQVGNVDASGVFQAVPLSLVNLVDFQSVNEAYRELILYFVCKPPAAKPYFGESMFVVYSTKDISAAPGAVGAWAPIRDLATAQEPMKPQDARDVLPVDRFLTSADMPAGIACPLSPGLLGQTANGAARRLYLPSSKFIAQHQQPNEPDVHDNGVEQFDVPFGYEVANATDFDDSKKSILGGRIMQMVCHYLFDNTGSKELAYFPFMTSESRGLTDKIVDQLGASIRAQGEHASDSRTDILKQILVKHGRRYFDEYAVLTESDGTRYGYVWDVLQKINELFVMFTVTITTTISNRSKDDIEVLRLIEVPIVVRVFDDTPPLPSRRLLLTFQTDYNALMANAALYQSFHNEVVTTLATALSVPTSYVQVTLSQGSVKVHAHVTFPAGTSQQQADTTTNSVAPQVHALFSAGINSHFVAKYAVTGVVTGVVVAPHTPTPTPTPTATPTATPTPTATATATPTPTPTLIYSSPSTWARGPAFKTRALPTTPQNTPTPTQTRMREHRQTNGTTGRTMTLAKGGTLSNGTAVLVDGELFMTGANGDGQIGNDSTENAMSPKNSSLYGALRGQHLVAVAGGSFHTVGLDQSGRVYTWGFNENGQLGNDSIMQAFVPIDVSSYGSLHGKTIASVACGYGHTVALDCDGHVHTWGYNYYGQLGDSTLVQSLVPIDVSNYGSLKGKTITAVSCGYYHTVAIDSEGHVHAWGYNYYGQLGNDSTTQYEFPVEIGAFGSLVGRTVVAMSCGYYFSMALDSDGHVHTWGYNNDGQLGNDSTVQSLIPVDVSTSGSLLGKTVTEIATGNYHAVALDSAGAVHTWGYNYHGQLGNDSTKQSEIPIDVSNFGSLSGSKVTEITCGALHTVALDDAALKKVHTWGRNLFGQLGVGSTTDSWVPIVGRWEH